MESNYNVLVIGKSGVGKSSFINYIFQTDGAKVGAGKPVTERGFHQFDFKLENLDLNVYDSWGLEVDKHEEWMSRFSNELQDRGIEKPANEWFHSVFYLINAGGHRVEDADISIIKYLIKQNYSVNVVLSKADMVGEVEEQSLIDAIRKDIPSIPVVGVCSGGQDRSGKKNPFGREKVIKQINRDCYSSLVNRLPKHLYALVEEWASDWEENAYKIMSNVGYFNDDDIEKEVIDFSKNELKNIDLILKNAINHTVKVYEKIFNEMKMVYSIKYEFKPFASKAPDLEWWEVGLAIAAFPLVGAVFAIKGKELNLDSLRSGFRKRKHEVLNNLVKEIKKIETQLIASRDDALLE